MASVWLFPRGISDNLALLRARYDKQSLYSFDSYNVLCGVTKWTSPKVSYTASASCITDDHNLKGFDQGRFANIYRSKKFVSKLQAEAHLERQILAASKKHKATRFYRSNLVFFDGEECDQWEFCLDGVWCCCEYPFY